MWSRNERSLLHDMKKTCLIHLYLQSGSAHFNYLIHNAITVPNIMLNAITGVSIFSTSGPEWRMASGVMAMVSTVLSSLSRQWAPGEKAQLHASITKQYQSIIREINTKLMLEIPESGKMFFIDHIKTEIDKLLAQQPEPAFVMVRKFEKQYHEHVEKALYPEYSYLEEEMIREATRISSRVSRAHTRMHSAFMLSSTYSTADVNVQAADTAR